MWRALGTDNILTASLRHVTACLTLNGSMPSSRENRHPRIKLNGPVPNNKGSEGGPCSESLSVHRFIPSVSRCRRKRMHWKILIPPAEASAPKQVKRAPRGRHEEVKQSGIRMHQAKLSIRRMTSNEHQAVPKQRWLPLAFATNRQPKSTGFALQ
jgi:hypothetical protein